ncbi:hypothetical protein J2T13_001072 [Paenibacillus sp. DS2015]|uniref:hypothetical protein n=1 Tax=Paenibacillus sp. DS2015 TaxID=3373917 RepID=UPI003D22C05D
MKKKGKFKNFLYMLLALGMLLYAIPNLSFSTGSGWIAAFGFVWVLFAFLVIGAHLHFILGVDEEKKKALDRIRAAKLAKWQLSWPEEPEKSKSV